MNKDVTISDFLNGDYKRYAMYVIESRAIASIIDGFKTVNRKIIFVAEKSTRKEKCKVNVLSGRVIAEAQYHHGNVSCEDGIVKMVQKFKNNIPLLDDIGSFGSLRNPYAASSRYTSTRLSPIFDFIFKDEYLLDHNKVDGISCEPKFYLPIIPMLLVNGSTGIAIGFASNILSRSPLNIIECCQNHLNGKKMIISPPITYGFNGVFKNDEDNHKRWEILGKYEIKGRDIHVTELTVSMTYEKYEKILDDLVDRSVIKSYKDNGRGFINYIIKVDDKFLKLDSFDILKKLKLVEYETENYTTLDECGKLKIFENTSDIIKYFVDFRLAFYDKRKEFMLNKMNNDLKVLANRGRFIKAILDGKLKVNNVAKAQIIEGIELMNLDKIDDSYDYLLRMSIYSLTKEMYDKLKEDFTIKKEEIKTLEATYPKDMYILDLNELKKKFK